MANITDVDEVNHSLTMEKIMIQADIHSGAGHNSLRFEIVQTQEQMLDALSIRAIVYIEENSVAARQAIDGNDFQATHVVGYLGDEPICAIRIRWFSSFAKLERMAMRKAYRDPRRVKSFIEFAFAHIARKGYATVLTHASPVYARLWRKMLQFQEVTSKVPVTFGGHAEPYIELIKHLDVPDDAITTQTDPTMLFRVEGTWDKPSKYEAHE